MKVIGYIRVSTASQAEDGISLDAQRDRIHKWAELNEGEVSAVFEDAGISGKDMSNRPGLAAAMLAADKGTALVTYSISRLARSTVDMLTIARQLEYQGADLVSLSEKIDTTTAAGRMIFRMLAVLAEFERDQTRERTASSLDFIKRELRDKGTWTSRKSGRQVTRLGSPDPRRGGTVIQQRVREYYSHIATLIPQRDWTAKAAAAFLNSAGYKTINGAQFSHTTVLRLWSRVSDGIF